MPSSPFPPFPLRKSLLLRLGLVLALLTALALISMLSSVFIADTSAGFAAAINQAGTLRMQSYRIASSLVHTGPRARAQGAVSRALMEEFEERLESPRIVAVLGKGIGPQLEQTYRGVERRWREEIRLMLERYLTLLESPLEDPASDALIDQARDFYLERVDGFVAEIDHLVGVLELEAEAKIRRLRALQLVALLLTLPVLLLALHLAQSRVVAPLRGLLAGARAARRGDFSVRIAEPGEDELGQLGKAYNRMAKDLSKSYAELEQRVRDKTLDLERSNRSLELLYRTTRRFSEASPNRETLEELLRDIGELVGVRAGTVCLGQPGDEQAFKLASTSSAIAEGGYFDGEPDCRLCMGDGSSHRFLMASACCGTTQVFSTPIRDQAEQVGVLLVEMPEGCTLEEWQQRLLETVARHIAFAINASQRTAQGRMLSLLEERGVIARELHDSLAQSLSYLKIQVGRLDMALNRGLEREEIVATSAKLRDGLNGAYQQLRELLTTFRLRITEAGLGAALEETVREYRERGGVEIELVNRMVNCHLSPNEEIHLIQVIREALSNVLRHAHASHAWVRLECDLDGRVVIEVEDDGVGMPSEAERLHHYGLAIMAERAQGLGGELELVPGERGGTRVRLVFTIADARL